MKNPNIISAGERQVDRERDIDIDDVIDQFLATKRAENTRRAYQRDIATALDSLGVTKLSDFGSIQFHDLVAKIMDHLEKGTKYDLETKRVLNPKTVNRRAFAISAFFRFLMHSYNYPKNPLDAYQAHKIQKYSNTPSLSAAQIIDVINDYEKHHKKSQTKFRNYLCICCLAVLALRRAELVGMKWSDVNFTEGTINIVQKGGSYKLLPIPKKLLSKLIEYRNQFSQSDYVFSPVRNNRNGKLNKPINADYIYQFVTKSIPRITKGSKATPHSFRKSFIEIALNNQEDFISIINATGHSTVEMVKYYDTRDTLKNNAVNGMAKFI